MVKNKKVSLVAPVMSVEDTLTEEQKNWWKTIKAQKLEIYGLKDQTVADYATPMNMDSDSLYLTVKASAAVPAIEMALTGCLEVDKTTKAKYPKFSMDTVDKYIVIKPAKGKVVKGADGKLSFVLIK